MIFVDTGAFLARHVASDQYHGKAAAAWGRLLKANTRCFTSNFVLDEAMTLLARRAGYAFAVERGRNLLASEALTVLRPGREDELAALDELERLADQKVSFTDCVSFVLMRKLRLKRAFTFDAHFRLAGFTQWP